jgi:hypothetical protein
MMALVGRRYEEFHGNMIDGLMRLAFENEPMLILLIFAASD